MNGVKLNAANLEIVDNLEKMMKKGGGGGEDKDGEDMIIESKHI